MQDFMMFFAMTAGILFGAGGVAFFLYRADQKRKARIRDILDEADRRESAKTK